MADTSGSIKRYVSVDVCGCIQTSTQLLNVNAANLHRFPGVHGRSRRGTTFQALAQHYLRGVRREPPRYRNRGVDIRTGNGWVRVILLVFLRTSSNRTAAGWFARCDSSVHCRPLAARGVLFLILQFLSFSICFDFVLTYLLKRIKYKLIDK